MRGITHNVTVTNRQTRHIRNWNRGSNCSGGGRRMNKNGHFQHWGITEFMTFVKNAQLGIDQGINESPSAAYIERTHERYLNFCSINFLSPTDFPEVKKAFLEGLDRYGYVTGGSRCTIGIPRVHVELEEKVSQVLKKDKTLTFMTGWLANQGFASSLTMKIPVGKENSLNNSDAVIFLDQDSHRSILNSFSGKKHSLVFFKHNDADQLDHLMKKYATRKSAVIIESVYSSDGSVAPMKDILSICDRYGAVSYVDNANGFLVYGAPHRPFYSEFQYLPQASVEMLSFSKSVGLEGGAVSGSTEFIEFMELLSPTAIFTAMIQPPTAMAILKVVELLHSRSEIIDNYLRIVEEFRESLFINKFIISKTPSHFISIFIGKDRDAVFLEQWLKKEKGILAPVFRFPAVKKDKAGLRILPSRCHTRADIERMINALNEANDILKFKDIEKTDPEYVVKR